MAYRRSYARSARRMGVRAGRATYNFVKKYAEPTAVGVLSYAAQKFRKSTATSGTKPSVKQGAKASTSYPRKLLRNPEAKGGHQRTDTGAGGELTVERYNVPLGSKKGLNRKLIRANQDDTYFRYAGLNPFMNTTVAGSGWGSVVGGGFYGLTNLITSITPTAAFIKFLPLHVYDITCINNLIAGAATAATPAWALNLTGTVGAGPIFPPTGVSFNQMSCENLTGTGISSQLQLMKSKAQTIQPIEECLQEYVSVALNCYGATNMATEWSIKIFQLKDDNFHPYELSLVNPPAQTPYDSLNGAITFWESFACKSYKHPLAKTSTDWKKHIKLLKEVTFVQQPRLSNETDAVLGHAKQVKIFVPMYRKSNYKWLDPALDSDVNNINSTPNENGQLSCYLKPKARIYMSIQATNVTQTVNPVVNTTSYCPTYDLELQYKFTDLA